MSYLKTLFLRPKEIYTGRNMKWRDFWLIISGFILLRVMLLFAMVSPSLGQMNADANQVADSIPTFEIKNGHLVTEKENYIFQTDSLIFYFNPEGDFTKKDVDKNDQLFHPYMSLALMPQKIYLKTSFFEREIDYERLPDLDNQFFIRILKQVGKWTAPFLIFTGLFIFIFLMINYIIELITLSCLGLLFARFVGIPLSFQQTIKIMMLASLLPILVMSILQTLGLSISWHGALQSILVGAFFVLTVTEMRKRMNR